MSVHSPCKALSSFASSLSKEQSQVELELTLLEALEIYPPVKLRGNFDRQFLADEVLHLLDEMLLWLLIWLLLESCCESLMMTLTFLTTRKTLPCLRVSLIWKNSLSPALKISP
ncbi:hypothetical protein HID58_022716, partial [Brassica napus]